MLMALQKASNASQVVSRQKISSHPPNCSRTLGFLYAGVVGSLVLRSSPGRVIRKNSDRKKRPNPCPFSSKKKSRIVAINVSHDPQIRMADLRLKRFILVSLSLHSKFATSVRLLIRFCLHRQSTVKANSKCRVFLPRIPHSLCQSLPSIMILSLISRSWSFNFSTSSGFSLAMFVVWLGSASRSKSW
jgi:hypothetical protein